MCWYWQWSASFCIKLNIYLGDWNKTAFKVILQKHEACYHCISDCNYCLYGNSHKPDRPQLRGLPGDGQGSGRFGTFSDKSQSHLSNFLKEKSSKALEVLDKIRQIVVTTQTIGVLLLLLFGVRLCVFFSLLYPPQKESRFTFIRRPFEKMKSLFDIEENNKGLSGNSGQEQTEI